MPTLDIIKRWRVAWLEGDAVEEEHFNTFDEAKIYASIIQDTEGHSIHVEEMMPAH